MTAASLLPGLPVPMLPARVPWRAGLAPRTAPSAGLAPRGQWLAVGVAVGVGVLAFVAWRQSRSAQDRAPKSSAATWADLLHAAPRVDAETMRRLGWPV